MSGLLYVCKFQRILRILSTNHEMPFSLLDIGNMYDFLTDY